MSKALVIKGANFALNKVETITLTQTIPCTGISLSADTISLTTLGATSQLTATLTPANTTETLIWSSSDDEVATVSGGLVTSVSVGTATITATCGTQSASCVVTSTHSVDADVAYIVENGAYTSGTELPTKNYVGRSTGNRGRLYYSTQEYGDYRAFSLESNVGKFAIPLPNGTSKVTFIAPEDFRTQNRFHFVNAEEKQTYIGGADGNCAKVIAYYEMGWNASYPYEMDISNYDGINGFVFSCTTNNSSVDASSVTSHCMIVFS